MQNFWAAGKKRDNWFFKATFSNTLFKSSLGVDGQTQFFYRRTSCKFQEILSSKPRSLPLRQSFLYNTWKMRNVTALTFTHKPEFAHLASNKTDIMVPNHWWLLTQSPILMPRHKLSNLHTSTYLTDLI